MCAGTAAARKYKGDSQLTVSLFNTGFCKLIYFCKYPHLLSKFLLRRKVFGSLDQNFHFLRREIIYEGDKM